MKRQRSAEVKRGLQRGRIDHMHKENIPFRKIYNNLNTENVNKIK